jgi:HAD superfamily hydrolase (TIGR01509 family)
MVDLINLVKDMNAIIFDMDGTIVNTEGLHAKAAAIVLKDIGVNIDVEGLLHQYYGMTDTVVLKALCPNFSSEEIENTILKKNQHLIKIFHSMTPAEKVKCITPGLFDFLEYLTRKKKKIAVISASEDIIVTETLLAFSIFPFVDLQMGRNQTLLTKPHPDPYIEGMRRLGTTKDDTLIFEDSPTGLISAQRSGAKTIRITQFTHSNEASEHEERLNFLID